MKRKHKPTRMRNWIVMWSYQDRVGYDSGKIEIQAPTRKAAEQQFRDNNRMRVVDGKVNPAGGFEVEGVLTYDEWTKLGRPTRL